MPWILGAVSWVLGAVPYLLALGTTALGGFGIFKDWHNYKHPRVQKSVAAVFCLVGVLTLIRQYRDDMNKSAEKQRQTEAAKYLQGQVEAANAAQKANTKLFLESFGKLSQKVNDLQAQVKTDDLQKKLTNVQAELQATEKALAPGPKSVLRFTFVLSPGTDPAEPVTSITLPLTSEGLVHIPFTIMNSTDVTASDGEATLRVCEACKYATEPTDFRKLPGQPDTERNMPFNRVLPFTHLPEKSFDLSVPPAANKFEIGFGYRCQNCVLDKTLSKAIVYVARPFVRPLPVIPKPLPIIPKKKKSGR